MTRVAATYDVFDGAAYLYAFDLPTWDGSGLPAAGTIVDLAQAPPAFADSPRMRAQAGCLVYCRRAEGSALDLRPLRVAGTPLTVQRPLSGATGIDRRVAQMFPSPAADTWYARLLSVPMNYAPEPAPPRLQRSIPVAPYFDNGDAAYSAAVSWRDVALSYPLLHRRLPDFCEPADPARRPVPIVFEAPMIFPYPSGDSGEWHHGLLSQDLPERCPTSTFAFAVAAETRSVEDLRREIIDFDSEAQSGLQFLAFTTATGLSHYTEITWPKGLAPRTGPTPSGPPGGPLPQADVQVVTWTVDEGHALSRVLTPGKDSHNDYVHYTHNYDTISRKMRAGCPATEAKRLGAFWTTTIGKKSVVIFKSESHMSQDGPELPNIDVWRQIIQEVQPKLVITTGTAGGIGTAFEVGDVVVSPVVRFDCIKKFKKEPFATASFTSSAPLASHFATAKSLFNFNSAQLPKDNTRPPKIVKVPVKAIDNSVLTTDYFGFDTSDNHYKLQGLGDVSEMGDAVLGLVAAELGPAAPRWLAIRNVSDPQIKADGLTSKQQAQIAAQIYKGFGRWSSVCSAIVCWASIAAEK